LGERHCAMVPLVEVLAIFLPFKGYTGLGEVYWLLLGWCRMVGVNGMNSIVRVIFSLWAVCGMLCWLFSGRDRSLSLGW